MRTPCGIQKSSSVPFTVYKDEICKDKDLDGEAGTGSHNADRAKLTPCTL